MNTDQLAAKLRRLPNKRKWCLDHKLPERTLWRLLSVGANPTAATMAAFANAIKRKR